MINNIYTTVDNNWYNKIKKKDRINDKRLMTLENAFKQIKEKQK